MPRGRPSPPGPGSRASGRRGSTAGRTAWRPPPRTPALGRAGPGSGTGEVSPGLALGAVRLEQPPRRRRVVGRRALLTVVVGGGAGVQRGAAAGSAGCRGLARFLQAAVAHAAPRCLRGPVAARLRPPRPPPPRFRAERSVSVPVSVPPQCRRGPPPPAPRPPSQRVLTSVFILGGEGLAGRPVGSRGGGGVSPRGWGLAPCTQERAQRRHRASGVQGTPQGGGLPAAPHPSTPMPGPTPPCRDPAPLRVSDLPTPRVPPPRAHRPAAGPRGCRRPRYRPHSPRREPPRRCRSPAPRAAAGSRIPAGRHRAGSGGAGRGRAERSGAERALPGPGPPPPAPAPPGTRPEPSTGTVPGTHPLRPATNRPGTEPSTHPACSGTEPGTPFSALSGFPPAWGCLQSPPPPPRVPKPLPHL